MIKKENKPIERINNAIEESNKDISIVNRIW